MGFETGILVHSIANVRSLALLLLLYVGNVCRPANVWKGLPFHPRKSTNSYCCSAVSYSAYSWLQLPGRSLGELVEFYYLWKKTERHDHFVQQFQMSSRQDFAIPAHL